MADYKVTDTELTSIANAIRTKGGTQSQLEFPTGFVSAVQAIPSGGGGSTNILSGKTDPASGSGNNGAVYLKYVEVPDEYYQLDYIATGETSGPYIDTGLTSSQNISAEMSVQFTNNPTNNTWFYGAFYSSKGSPILGYQNGGVEGYIVSGGAINTYDTNNHIYLVDPIGISVDGHYRQGGIWSAIYVGGSLYLFARGGDICAINNTRIRYCKMYNDGVLVRFFIPAKRKSDDVIGMYDSVNGVFYQNAGSGSFLAGELTDQSPIIKAWLKVDGVWQNLIGSDINDVNLGS